MPDTKEKLVSQSFPFAGISLVRGFGDQQPVQMPNGDWGRTTRQGVNVRGYEASSQRLRGGSRPGLSKYVAAAVPPGSWLVQGLNYVVTSGSTPVQLSQSGRNVYLVAVSQGQVYYSLAGSGTWTLAPLGPGVNNPPLVFTGQVFSTSLGQQLWFADGSNWCSFTPTDSAGPRVNQWAASAGSLPVDSKNNTPRLICTWRGRVVLSGLLLDPTNIFASAAGVANGGPTNFDYTGQSLVIQVPGSPPVTGNSPAQAWALSASPAGLVGDVVTSLIPYNDDVLIIGGDHTIYAINGDITAGGQVDRISDSVGIAWGQPWCKDPDGTLYFFSNRTGIYAMEPGGKPVRMSQQIEQIVNNTDTGANTIQMQWNDRWQGFHVFITPSSQAASTTHLFWEKRTGAWWQDTFGNNLLNPTASVAFDGNTVGDRVVLIGSWDGYVRALDPTATSDDGTPISSSVLIGPFLTQDMDEMLLKDLQAILGETSGTVTYQVFVGRTAEQALSNPAVASGTWSPSRNLSNLVRRAGHAVYVQLSSTNQWAMEAIKARVATQGKVRRRGA